MTPGGVAEILSQLSELWLAAPERCDRALSLIRAELLDYLSTRAPIEDDVKENHDST